MLLLKIGHMHTDGQNNALRIKEMLDFQMGFLKAWNMFRFKTCSSFNNAEENVKTGRDKRDLLDHFKEKETMGIIK